MRKTIFFMLALPLLLLTACTKSPSSDKCTYTTNTAVAPASEVASLKAYLDANSITYTQHSSGIFFKVAAPGAGTAANVCSDVTVKYTGRLLTSNVTFDQSTSGVTFTLGQLISGWQIGIPLIQKGGSITLYIPPSLGYGNQDVKNSQGVVVIPANSNLVFTIELVDVQ